MFCYLHVGVRRGHQTNAAETLTLLVFDERQKEEETIFQENHKSTKGDNQSSQSSSVNINIFIDDRSN